MFNQRIKKVFKTLSSNALLIISIAQCMIYPLNYSDYGIYAEAGDRIIHGFDPYSSGSLDGAFRSGYVAPLLLWFFTQLVPVSLGVIAIRLLSLFSIYKLVQSLDLKLNRSQTQFLFSLLLWTTPVRAIISNTQLTGLLVGIYLLATWMPERISPRVFLRGIILTLSSLLMIIGLDLRPQLFLPAILIWAVYNKKCRFALLTLAFYLSLRLLIDFASPFNLNSNEINILSSLNSQDLSKSDTTSFLRVVQYFGHNSHLANIYSLVIWITFMLIAAKKIAYKNSYAIFISGLGSLFLTFVHPYDFVFIAIVIIFENQKRNWSNLLWLWGLFLLIFPKSGSQILLNLGFGLVCILLILIGKAKHGDIKYAKSDVQTLILAFSLSLLSSSVIARYSNEPIFHSALQLAVVTSLVVIAYAKEYLGARIRLQSKKGS